MRVLQEKVLDRKFPENMEVLLEMDELEGVFSGYMDSTFDEGHSGEGTA